MAINKKRKIEVKKKTNKSSISKVNKETHFKLLNRNCRKAFNKTIGELVGNYNPFFGSKYPLEIRNKATKHMVTYMYEKTKVKALPETRKEFIQLLEEAGDYARVKIIQDIKN